MLNKYEVNKAKLENSGGRYCRKRYFFPRTFNRFVSFSRADESFLAKRQLVKKEIYSMDRLRFSSSLCCTKINREEMIHTARPCRRIYKYTLLLLHISNGAFTLKVFIWIFSNREIEDLSNTRR